MAALRFGRGIMLVSNLAYSVGSFFADWNVTHIYNPQWPGHAKFHNGQTMNLGVLLSLASAFFLFRSQSTAAAKKDDLRTAAIIGSLYCVAGVAAINYPGATWNDPPDPSGRPQLFLFPGLVAMNWIGYWLAVVGINKSKQA